MLEFFDRLFGRDSEKPKSGKIAKDRLQFVLVQDRISLPADQLQEMKREIIQVISKYVAVDMENVDFALTNRERTGLLIAEIPFSSVSPEDPTSARNLDEADMMSLVDEALDEIEAGDSTDTFVESADDSEVEANKDEAKLSLADDTAQEDATVERVADDIELDDMDDPMGETRPSSSTSAQQDAEAIHAAISKPIITEDEIEEDSPVESTDTAEDDAEEDDTDD